ncbi:MAG: hypothetical protein LBC25_00360 [Holosporales bacterium]|nr:hypothetical protein [Holosporales bacterium]
MFNCEKFVRDTKDIHLTSSEVLIFDGLEHVDVRNVIDLDGTYEYKVRSPRKPKHFFKNIADNKVILRRALDVICNDIVGQTLLKLLTVKCGLSGKKIGLVNYSGDGSCYDETVKAGFVNLSLYQSDGSGIPERQYYSVNSSGEVVHKLKSLEQSIFHELVHGLHYISDGKYADTLLCQDGSVMEEIWSDDEELRTITGYMYDQPYDPICDHVFDYSLHGHSFCPRYGHVEWSTEDEEEAAETQLDLKRNLSSQIRYMKGWSMYQLPDPPSIRKQRQVKYKRRPPRKAHLQAKPAVIKPQVRLPKFK